MVRGRSRIKDQEMICGKVTRSGKDKKACLKEGERERFRLNISVYFVDAC